MTFLLYNAHRECLEMNATLEWPGFDRLLAYERSRRLLNQARWGQARYRVAHQRFVLTQVPRLMVFAFAWPILQPSHSLSLTCESPRLGVAAAIQCYFLLPSALLPDALVCPPIPCLLVRPQTPNLIFIVQQREYVKLRLCAAPGLNQFE